MTIEEYKDGYFEYLMQVITKAIMNADVYGCRDFDILKLDLIVNINRLFSTRERYNQLVNMLRKKEEVINNGYDIKCK